MADEALAPLRQTCFVIHTALDDIRPRRRLYTIHLSEQMKMEIANKGVQAIGAKARLSLTPDVGIRIMGYRT